MPGTLEKKFIKLTEEKAFDREHRAIMSKNIGHYNHAFEESTLNFFHLENSKKKAHLIKWRAIENLDKYLHEFETQFLKRGGKVIWANDAQEALQEIDEILKKVNAKQVIKAKSMVTEEIKLNEFLEKKGVEVWEGDLGEFIVQQNIEKPYHIVTPAMHLTKEKIAKIFHEKWEVPLDATPEQLTLFARNFLRDKFRNADVGITGANFLIAENGSVVITENEGNARLTTTFPKVHIAIAGIEKILPQMKDLSLFWPLLSSHGTGQKLTTYNTILSGPRQDHEIDGPEEMYVILLDNGRTDLLAKSEQRQGLYCIRCGACLNVCPIYQNIGGHAYQNTYSGPIGSLISPHTQGMKDFSHLSQASTLCGKCTEVCPVKIPIDRMLTLNRRDAVEEKIQPFSENLKWKGFTWFTSSRKRMQLLGSKMKNFLLKMFFPKMGGLNRKAPKFEKDSFSKSWQEKDHSKD